MNKPVRIALLILLLASGLPGATPASARGAASIMSSPGYQRALEESRKRYRDSVRGPAARSPAVKPRKTSRHHHRWH